MKMNFFKKILFFFCLIILFNTSFVFVFGENDINNGNTLNVNNVSADNNYENVNLDLTSKAVLLLDIDSGRTFYSKNETERMYPASTTKILTAILTLENCKLDDVVTVTHDISGAIPYGYTTVDLKIDEQFTVEQLLEILMVYSANDVANLLAEHMGGSVQGFSDMMNQKMLDLGLTDSHFTNPSGIHDNNHYTTAKDLAGIFQYCIQNDDFIRFSSMTSCKIPATNKHAERSFESTDKLIVKNSSYYYPYLVCGKTGYTTESGECLVSFASKDDLRLLCVVLGGKTVEGSSTRFTETKKLYDFVYDNFSESVLFTKDDYVTDIQVENATSATKNLILFADSSVSALLPNSFSKDELDCKITLKDSIVAPISQGDVLGTASYVIDSVEYKTNLIASHDVKKSYLFYYMLEILVGIILIVIVCFILSHKGHKR